MQRCFAAECEERRRRMNMALEAIAPGQAPELRSTLIDAGAPAGPIAVSMPPRAKRGGRRRVVGALLVSVALAASVAVATMDPTVTSEAAPRTRTAQPAHSLEVTPTPVEIAPPPPTIDRAPSLPAVVADPASSSPEPEVRPAVLSAPARRKVVSPPPAPSVQPPDVDPTPF
jgi:hypothetical protein